MASHRDPGDSLVRHVFAWEWPRAYPIVQFPNAPLLVGFAGSLVARVTEGGASDAAFAVATAGYAGWAGLELARGDNAFRRVLGAVGIAWVITRVV